MHKLVMTASLALLGLAGCDRFGPGGNETAGGNAAAEAGAGNVSRAESAGTQPGISDAGVTRSRSLAGLTGGGLGGKDPGAVAAGAAGSIQPGLLVGRWSDDGNCKQDYEFFPDGTFRTYDGIEGGWTLDGDRLTLTGAGEPVRVTLRAIDANRLTVINPDGSTGQSVRC
jgi:hypothetical protein